MQGEAGPEARQSKVPGFDQERLSASRVVLVGCGGINGTIAMALVRKGIGKLVLLDHDVVELSNLNRQLFFKEDLYQSKALSLAKNLERFATQRTTVEAHVLEFEEALAIGIDLRCNAAIVGVDNGESRIAVNRHYWEKQIPTITAAVTEDANQGYVFVQERPGACFGCVFGGVPRRAPCPGAPAILDILLTIDGLAVYALDTLLMDRPRSWNYREVFLDGSVPDRIWTIKSKPECRTCGGMTRNQSE